MSTYFQGLNYGLANEDTKIEFELAPENAKSIFTVCGSGSRVLPLIAKNPENIHVVDLSDVQLALFRLRLAAVKNLSYDEFLYLLGYTNSHSKKRSDLMMRLNLSKEDLVLWKSEEAKWEARGFIYLGRWENHFMMLGRFYKKISFTDVRPVFEAKNLGEQRELLKKHFHPRLFNLYTKIVLNDYVSNKLLYKGHFAGGKDKKTVNMTASEFVINEFSDLFQNTWVRGNYFLNMIFLNEVSYKESFPIECDEDLFTKIKSSKTQVFCHQDNLLNLMYKEAHDFYSLSDTFSYMTNAEVGNFLGNLPQNIKKGSKIVIRTFMRKPTFGIASPWATDGALNLKMAKKDCTRMYEFSILEKIL